MATAEQIRDRAANDLGILPLGQALMDKDRVRIEAAYAEVHAMLVNEKLADWVITAPVPDRFVQYIASLVAESCLNTFGVSVERVQMITAAAKAALPVIRQLVADTYSSATVTAKIVARVATMLELVQHGQPLKERDTQRINEAFTETYWRLNHDGLATWGISSNVPSKLIPLITVLVAESCLPEYKVSVDTYQKIKADAKAALPVIRQLVADTYSSSTVTAKIVARVATMLKLAQHGQPLKERDAQRINEAFTETYWRLNHDGLATWGISSNVPSKLIPLITVLVAESCLPEYKVSVDTYQKIKDESVNAMRQIRYLQQPAYASADDVEDF